MSDHPKTRALYARNPKPHHEDLLAALREDAYDELDEVQQGYCQLLADYVLALAHVVEAADSLTEADATDFVSGFHHAGEHGEAYSPKENSRLWQEFTRGAEAVARVAQNERDNLDCSLPYAAQHLIEGAGLVEDDDEEDVDDEEDDANQDDGSSEADDDQEAYAAAWIEAIRGYDHAAQALRQILRLPAAGYRLFGDTASDWQRLVEDAQAQLWHIQLYAGAIDAQMPPLVKRKLRAEDEDDEPELLDLEVIDEEADEPNMLVS